MNQQRDWRQMLERLKISNVVGVLHVDRQGQIDTWCSLRPPFFFSFRSSSSKALTWGVFTNPLRHFKRTKSIQSVRV